MASNDYNDDVNTVGNTTDLKPNEEPATKHDVTEGGLLGAVGGAIVGALAGGPIGAIIGAVAGGAASAAAVDVVDKHDNDFDRTVAPNTYVGSGDTVTDDTVRVPGYDNTLTTDTEPVYETRTVTQPAELNTASTTLRDDRFVDDRLTDVNNNGDVIIPIVEEELEVGKRQVQSGGARVHTEVIETPVSEQINLHDETVTVNRHAVDRPVTDADAAFQDRSFEVTETSEVPVVAKTARVVEEVVIGKTATDRTETINDTVRRTDVDVVELDADNLKNRTIDTV